MNKSAEAAIDKPITDAIQEAIEEAKADSDMSFLKKQKEEARSIRQRTLSGEEAARPALGV